MPHIPLLPIQSQIHHFGYVVSDLESAVQEFVTKLGAGPFFVMKDVPLEKVTSQGEPAVFGHSSAFGNCGSFTVELMEIHRCEPARVRDAFAQAAPALHHVAWVAPDLDPAVKSLERQGIAEYLRAGLGDIQFAYHDAAHLVGHHLEIHHDSAGLRGFFGMIRDARDGWDGSEPVRTPAS